MNEKAKQQRIQSLMSAKIIAIIRIQQQQPLLDIVRALVQGGICAVEITLNTPGALECISTLDAKMGNDILIGAGTVLGVENAHKAISAGAHFILSPIFELEVIKVCKKCGVVSIPGAFTPSEIYTAWKAGADFVKVFPASQTGTTYIKDILAPLPQIKLMPVGGVTIKNMVEYFAAGATLVGIGSSLITKHLLEAGDWGKLSARASRFVKEAHL